jgi:hypothetical protein
VDARVRTHGVLPRAVGNKKLGVVPVGLCQCRFRKTYIRLHRAQIAQFSSTNAGLLASQAGSTTASHPPCDVHTSPRPDRESVYARREVPSTAADFKDAGAQWLGMPYHLVHGGAVVWARDYSDRKPANCKCEALAEVRPSELTGPLLPY